MNRILIVGATSAIAEVAARQFAARGDALFLVARNQDKLDPVARDLSVRGSAHVTTHRLDADDLSAHRHMLDTAEANLGGIDIALIAYGTLPEQAACTADPTMAATALHTNAVSVIALATDLANRLERQGAGLIAVISSVAGDRGRASNYVYGSAKACVNTFFDGLRHRLHGSGVDVLTIRPGMVDTPMTAGFDKGPLFASADRVGSDIVKAVDKRRAVIYTPGLWRWIMAIIKSLPRAIFHRTRL